MKKRCRLRECIRAKKASNHQEEVHHSSGCLTSNEESIQNFVEKGLKNQNDYESPVRPGVRNVVSDMEFRPPGEKVDVITLEVPGDREITSEAGLTFYVL